MGNDSSTTPVGTHSTSDGTAEETQVPGPEQQDPLVTVAASATPGAGELERGATGDSSDSAQALVGKVAGTQDSTPLKFHVAITEHAYLQLDDVVTCSREVPGVGKVVTSGVVPDVVSRPEGAT